MLCNNHNNMKEIIENSKTNGVASLVVCLLILTTLLSIFALYSPFYSSITTKLQINPRNPSIIHPQKDKNAHCDLFDGQWVEDSKGFPLYTNATCPTIPTSKDCFLHGRNDKDFLYWRWKPHKCKLPRFELTTFYKIMRNKRLAFIGDSLARNQMESLLCLISQEEAPIDVYKDAKDRSRTWFFPRNNFTLMVLWTRFLVKGVEKGGGVFDLHLDEVDENWAHNVSQGLVDYAIVSSAQWYFKKNYLYEGRKLIGCLYCNQINLTQFKVSFASGKAFQTTLRYINSCKKCNDMVTLVRTISPSHFENGTWKTGGNCERSKPYNTTMVENLLVVSKSGLEWEVRNTQMQEIERAVKEAGIKRQRKIRALDITRAMLMRPDGHPGSHWRDKKKKGFNDCVHWCMPGPIDVWNDLLLALLRRVHIL
ncbi:Protein ALTERED XYLOGLUCAN 4-like [Bienertia sinuspersici]